MTLNNLKWKINESKVKIIVFELNAIYAKIAPNTN